MGLIARDFWALAQREHQVILAHIKRDSNIAAHDICQYSRRASCEGFLQGDVPVCALVLTLKDCNQNVSA